jgi:hypothetical protein
MKAKNYYSPIIILPHLFNEVHYPQFVHICKRLGKCCCLIVNLRKIYTGLAEDSSSNTPAF